jgi:hypothetical protein
MARTGANHRLSSTWGGFSEAVELPVAADAATAWLIQLSSAEAADISADTGQPTVVHMYPWPSPAKTRRILVLTDKR